jgi:polar amino acid transport system substrate-binding protein
MEQQSSHKIWHIVALVVAGLMVVVAIALLVTWLNDVRGGRNESSVATATLTPPVTGDGVWEQIQTSGRLRVGTSADYQPFSYYNASFQLDGFDVALIRQIGQQLGLQVELSDFAFDGLGGALQIGQIDVAIAAISVTSERQAVIDFSNVYYASTDAVLAESDSSIGPITAASQLAGYRVGVQKGSVYESWLRTTLVDPGLMPVGNLSAYTNIDQAINDLKAGLIQLVVLDLIPANSFIQQGGVKLVGENLNQQLYAIAAPQGADTLVNQLNGALTDLNNTGTFDQLVSQYLGASSGEIQPLPTQNPAQPTPTAPPQACVDGMQFVADLNLPDFNMQRPPTMPPGQPFSKGWRLRNSGTCTWGSGYRLVYVQGNTPEARMGGQPTAITGQVPPGGLTDIYVNLVSPLTPGVYQGFWQMTNASGIPFGQMIWVGIQVVPSATATPKPTATPSPGMSFTADRTSITAGQPVTFSWTVVNGREAYFYPQGEPYWSGPVPLQGSRTVYPAQSTTYELRAVYNNGTVETRQIWIQVTTVPGAPVISRFDLNPPYEITAGQCVQISWQVQGTVNNVKLSRDQTVLRNGAPVEGSVQDCPPGTGTVTYTLEASGPGGTSRLQESLTIKAPAPQPTATPSLPQPPIIDVFSVDPVSIQAGQCVTGYWNVRDATEIVILRNGVVVLDNAQPQGSAQDCLNTTGTVVYRLHASNAGGTVFQEQTVLVEQAPPVNDLVGTLWQLVTYYDGVGATVSVIPGTYPDANFNSSGQMTGSAGCNTYQASYSANSGTIQIGSPITGQIMCDSPAGIMEQESRYLAAIQRATHYQVSGEQLILVDNTDPQNPIQVAVYRMGPTPR